MVVALMGLFLFGASSCDHVDDTTRVNNIASVLVLGTQLAVSEAVLSNPDLSKHFAVVPVAIKAAVDGDALTPDEVTQVVNGYLSGSGLDSTTQPLVQAGISLSFSAYKTFYTKNVGPNVKPHLKVLLLAIANGVQAGLNPTTGLSVENQSQSQNPIETLTEEDYTLRGE